MVATEDEIDAEDAILDDDRWMSHSLLSAPLNLGLLDLLEVVRAAEDAYAEGHAPIAAVEGFIRQVIGWRDYMWHLYWYFGEEYRARNELSPRFRCRGGSPAGSERHRGGLFAQHTAVGA